LREIWVISKRMKLRPAGELARAISTASILCHFTSKSPYVF
jgi:hypothetical protein